MVGNTDNRSTNHSNDNKVYDMDNRNVGSMDTFYCSFIVFILEHNECHHITLFLV